ncbi:HNH endonuclease signature motif containing protein [Tenacibaculum maritimum]|nr:HNH endonuclease signature motif containing protein [Tenacibaculum maritimum]MDB0602338.1 HNH endonuclease signature motif containing protein [Tenacibaculum maritimum]MDB0613501.1 HNH endonuclease signature motif containing protein [Tenacibaculum maritimum]
MPKKVLTPEIENYIKENYLLQSGASIGKKFNIAKHVVNRFKRNNNLLVPIKLKKKMRLDAFHKATKGKTNFTEKEDQFIKDNYLKLPVKTIADKIGRSGTGVNTALKRMNLEIPDEIIKQNKKFAQFKKGHVPENKGKKQIEYMSAEMIERTKATRFKKGNLPHNSQGINNGDVHIRKDSKGRYYKWIRESLGVWKMLHVFNWEKEFGPIPDGYIIVFKNKDSMNCEPSNLELITRAENMAKNTIHRYPDHIKENIRLISKINKTIKNQ